MRAGEVDPEDQVLLADSVGLALQIVLETLSPAERLAPCCTTCSTCRSTRSPPWSVALRLPRDNWPAERDDACAVPPCPRPTLTSPINDKSSTRFSPRPTTATSTRSWQCLIPTWC